MDDNQGRQRVHQPRDFLDFLQTKTGSQKPTYSTSYLHQTSISPVYLNCRCGTESRYINNTFCPLWEPALSLYMQITHLHVLCEGKAINHSHVPHDIMHIKFTNIQVVRVKMYRMSSFSGLTKQQQIQPSSDHGDLHKQLLVLKLTLTQ